MESIMKFINHIAGRIENYTWRKLYANRCKENITVGANEKCCLAT
jgi:hypothetical protein